MDRDEADGRYKFLDCRESTVKHPDISPLAARLARAKWAFSTRRTKRSAVRALITDRSTTPIAGDLVLATVTAVGQHNTVELPTGRKAFIHPGDEIVVCYGNRYAPDQFEAAISSQAAESRLASCNSTRKSKAPPRSRRLACSPAPTAHLSM
jgi:hypothetical protein